MKILIFGGNGMVGSSLTKILKNNNNFERVVSSSRKDTNLFSYDSTLQKIEYEKPDVIVNCAAKVGGIVANNSLPTEFIIENLKINLNILEVLKKYNAIRFINLGSSCIYPLGAKIPITEDQIMTGKLEPTNSPYAMAKLSAIEIGNSLSRQYGNKVLNLMPTNLYGPNDNFSEDSSHVIPGLISKFHNAKINNKKSVSVWGSGKPLREFLHVDDLSAAIEFLVLNDIFEGIYNVGSNHEVSIKELAELIKKTTDFKGFIDYDEKYPDGNPRKLIDSSKILQLGWLPKVSLEKGLLDTYKWFVEKY